ncbi:molybdenum cofactor guanylyltransferase [Pusillimonas sp. TS35]|nr:molybdenum cofactor guanylyltransferase [Pusillimonas sp. TS35]
MVDRAEYTGLVLAGGQGTRMQAVPGERAEKGLAPLRGEPLVAHACRALAPQVGQLMISANRCLKQYAAYAPVLPDDPSLGVGLGPLAGIERGLVHAGTPWLAVTPVDVLNIPNDMVARLAMAARRAGTLAAYALYARDDVRDGHRAHPLCAVLHASLAPNLRVWLQGGDRKVLLWMAHAGAVPVVFEGEGVFVNINTPQDLERAALGEK